MQDMYVQWCYALPIGDLRMEWRGRMVGAVAIDGGAGGERLAGTAADPMGSFGLAEQAVLGALRTASGPLCPADLIRELECMGFRNSEIRSAIWHLLDRHRIRLTRDLTLVLAVASVPAGAAPANAAP